MKSTVIIGATSAIGSACLRRLSGKIVLVGRSRERLELLKVDAALRGVETEIISTDLSDEDQVESLASELANRSVDQVILTAGVLSDEAANYKDWSQSVSVNLTAQAYLARVLFDQMTTGSIVFVGSVAGDRGRQSNAWYGAQKSAIETFANGLMHRNAVLGKNVSVSVIKPGFVRSPMTAHLPDSALFSEPGTVAKVVVKALESEKSQIVYAPRWWRMILLIVKAVPRFILHRTKL